MKSLRRLLVIELFHLCTKIDHKTHHDMIMEYAEKYVGEKCLKTYHI
jgi:hypothetical protein